MTHSLFNIPTTAEKPPGQGGRHLSATQGTGSKCLTRLVIEATFARSEHHVLNCVAARRAGRSPGRRQLNFGTAVHLARKAARGRRPVSSISVADERRKFQKCRVPRARRHDVAMPGLGRVLSITRKIRLPLLRAGSSDLGAPVFNSLLSLSDAPKVVPSSSVGGGVQSSEVRR